MAWISALPRLLAPAALLAATLAIAATPPVKGEAPDASAGKAVAGRRTHAKPVASRSTPAKGHTGTKAAAHKRRPKQKPGEVMELDWRDLLPEKERAHYSAAAPPPEHGPLGEGGPPALQKMTTTSNDDLADMVVRLPGFVVPISTPRKGLISEFFLVPYIGACIHVPPPPPNQMVYVTSATGIAADAIHEAYWVTGKMRIESRTTPLGTAAYAIAATKVELYQY